MKNLINSNIPYTQISKEVWISITRTLENEQIGELMVAFADYVYNGKTPEFNSKVMNGQWDLLIESTERMSQTYFKKVANAKESARKRIENKNSSMSNNNTSSDISNQTTRENCSDALKTTNTREIPNEFAIPTPEVDETVVDEGEIDDTGEYYDEWTDQCWSLIKASKLDYMNGDSAAIKECNIKLQSFYDRCVANGCSEEKLLSIRCAVEKEISEEIEREYNKNIA